MSRNCFPIVPFIVILAAIIAAGLFFGVRIKNKNLDDFATRSGDGLLLGLLLLGAISMAAFLVYSLGNIFPC